MSPVAPTPITHRRARIPARAPVPTDYGLSRRALERWAWVARFEDGITAGTMLVVMFALQFAWGGVAIGDSMPRLVASVTIPAVVGALVAGTLRWLMPRLLPGGRASRRWLAAWDEASVGPVLDDTVYWTTAPLAGVRTGLVAALWWLGYEAVASGDDDARAEHTELLVTGHGRRYRLVLWGGDGEAPRTLLPVVLAAASRAPAADAVFVVAPLGASAGLGQALAGRRVGVLTATGLVALAAGDDVLPSLVPRVALVEG